MVSFWMVTNSFQLKNIMLSQLQRIEQKFIHIEIDPSDQENHSEENLSMNYYLNVERESDTSPLWFAHIDVELRSESEKQPSSYEGHVSAVGQFHLDEDFPEDKASAMVYMNAGAILYASVRELIRDLTGRSLHGEIDLPILDARCFIPEADE